jgi:hypothetical protein
MSNIMKYNQYDISGTEATARRTQRGTWLDATQHRTDMSIDNLVKS